MRIPRVKRNANQEQIAQRKIVDYLRMQYKVFCWKNNSTGMYDPTKKIFRKLYSPIFVDGLSDITGVMPEFNGKMIACEIKRPDKKREATEHQKIFLVNVLSCGGLGFIAQNTDDVDEAMLLFRQGKIEDLVRKIQETKSTKR